MEQSTFITAYASLRSGAMLKNGTLICQFDEPDTNGLLKSFYKALALNYPKFFKMDALSKLGFLGAELLIDPAESGEDIALLFANRSSSLDTDVKYQQSITDRNNYFPSPAVFVYTLPNICLGEISIRHQLKSENSFFIFDAFNPEFMATYSNLLIATGKAESVLCGWVELFEDNYDAFFFRVGKQKTAHANDKDNLKTLYNK